MSTAAEDKEAQERAEKQRAYEAELQAAKQGYDDAVARAASQRDAMKRGAAERVPAAERGGEHILAQAEQKAKDIEEALVRYHDRREEAGAARVPTDPGPEPAMLPPLPATADEATRRAHGKKLIENQTARRDHALAKQDLAAYQRRIAQPAEVRSKAKEIRDEQVEEATRDAARIVADAEQRYAIAVADAEQERIARLARAEGMKP